MLHEASSRESSDDTNYVRERGRDDRGDVLNLCYSAHILFSSIGMCRMRRFLAVLRSFFHSSLLCTFSCYSSPPTILPSSLTSSCHLFFGLPLSLLVPQIHTQHPFGNSVFFHSLYMLKPT
jgi:hypothetical protein